MLRLGWIGTLVLLGAQLVLAVPASADDAGTITRYESDYTVRTDGVLAVVETITVSFPTPKHGIYRDFARSENGQATSIPDRSSLTATRDGKATPFVVSRTSTGLQIKIGDAGVTVTGTHVYRITYVATGAIVHGDDEGEKFEELYWDPIGSSWTLPIESSLTTFHLPGPIEFPTCYVGDEDEECGENGSDTVVIKTDRLASGTPVSARIDYKPAPGFTYLLSDLAHGAVLAA